MTTSPKKHIDDVDSLWFRHDGVAMRYRTIGDGSPLVILQGAWVEPHVFHTLIEKLAQDHTVIVPDIPPFGESSVPARVWSFNEYGEYFSHFLSSLGVGKVHILGHSFGGGVALALAARHADVATVVLINPAGKPFRYPHVAFSYPQLVVRAIVRLFLASRKAPFWLLIRDVLHLVIRKPRALTYIGRLLTKSLTTPIVGLAQIRKKIYILWAWPDEALGDAYLDELEIGLPGAQVERVSGFHNWVLVDQDRVYEYVKEWFS